MSFLSSFFSWIYTTALAVGAFVGLYWPMLLPLLLVCLPFIGFCRDHGL